MDGWVWGGWKAILRLCFSGSKNSSCWAGSEAELQSLLLLPFSPSSLTFSHTKMHHPNGAREVAWRASAEQHFGPSCVLLSLNCCQHRASLDSGPGINIYVLTGVSPVHPSAERNDNMRLQSKGWDPPMYTLTSAAQSSANELFRKRSEAGVACSDRFANTKKLSLSKIYPLIFCSWSFLHKQTQTQKKKAYCSC